jgi:hypothetical protein
MRFAHTTRLFENALLIHLSIGGGGSRAVVDDPERSFARDDDDDSTDSISTRLRMFLSFFYLFILRCGACAFPNAYVVDPTPTEPHRASADAVGS